MKCPFCGHLETQVVETRVSEEADFIRRRRQGGACDKRFTTYERPDVSFPALVKKDGRRVEYKRGKPKPEPFDEIQLCAQALCLEEMTGQIIAEGALWYMQTRHRVPVLFSDGLRAQTLAVIAQVRELLASGQTPPPVYGKRCKACSLVEICQPKLLERDRSVGYVEGLFGNCE